MKKVEQMQSEEVIIVKYVDAYLPLNLSAFVNLLS